MVCQPVASPDPASCSSNGRSLKLHRPAMTSGISSTSPVSQCTCRRPYQLCSHHKRQLANHNHARCLIHHDGHERLLPEQKGAHNSLSSHLSPSHPHPTLRLSPLPPCCAGKRFVRNERHATAEMRVCSRAQRRMISPPCRRRADLQPEQQHQYTPSGW